MVGFPARLAVAMPRKPCLDALDTLRHVMVRGLERRAIVTDALGRADFVAQVADLAEQGALTVYAWAPVPHHLHLVVCTGATPLTRAMRSSLTGCAGAFNRRHRRRGHRFQNRHNSSVVEEEPYRGWSRCAGSTRAD
jgi:hypothetical protein